MLQTTLETQDFTVVGDLKHCAVFFQNVNWSQYYVANRACVNV